MVRNVGESVPSIVEAHASSVSSTVEPGPAWPPATKAARYPSLDAALWVVNAYLLVYAVLLVTTGRLGDVLGQRRMFAAGLVVFTFASVLCGVSADAGQLIAARALQGLGGAMMAPQSLAMLTLLFSRERMGAALGLWSAVVGFSTFAGPTVGGWIVTNLDWRWIFFINLPIGLVVLAGTLLIVPDLRARTRHRLDVVGVALSGLALLALTYALIQGQRYDWGEISGIVSIPSLLVVGLGLLAAFAFWQSRQAEPLLPPCLFGDRNFSLMNWTNLAVNFAGQGIFLPITIYLQSVLGMSALNAGLTFAPMSLLTMVVAPFSGRVADRFGGKWLLIAGLLVSGSGATALLSMATLEATWTTFVLPFMLLGLGMGLVFPAMTSTAMRDIPKTDTGAASGVLNTTRQLGSVLGSAVVGAVLQALLAVSLHDQAVARAGGLPPQVQQPFVDSFAQAARFGFQVGAGQTGA
jgi:EmrB/QacA subfamily drug resistance transporter